MEAVFGNKALDALYNYLIIVFFRKILYNFRILLKKIFFCDKLK